MSCKAIVAILVLFGSSMQVCAGTIIHAGRLINGRDSMIHDSMSLLIDEGRIVAVRQGYLEPTSDDTLIDLRQYTVMPGSLARPKTTT